MNEASGEQRRSRVVRLLVVVVIAAGLARGAARAQTDASAGKAVGDQPGTANAPQADENKSAGKVVGDTAPAPKQDEAQPDKTAGKAAGEKQEPTAASSADHSSAAAAPSLMQKPGERKRSAWKMLEDAVGDPKHPQTRIEALAGLGLLRNSESELLIGNAMLDADVDVRTAAALAAGQTRDPNLSNSLRNLLDDKEPQVAFTAAMTLWKMGDRSGEDVLLAVVDGERKTQPGLVHGTQQKINRDLHNPSKLAKLGAMQGASMLLGPFGFGITAIEFMRQNGGDSARAAAIEQIAQEKTDPIHHELLDALKDKDPGVRAAAAKALVDYPDQETQDAVYTLLMDPKDPARLTAAASYLRIMGVPGPLPVRPAKAPARAQRRLPAKRGTN
jgi:HEAT repeat protein